MQTALTRPTSPALSGFTSSVPGRITLGIAATAVLAAAAHVAFPLPFTPVPFILTPLAVLGVGLAFGPVGAFAVLLAYLAEGAAGLPVFSPTGPGGLAQLFGATGGFLLSYPLVAALAGGLTRAFERRMKRFTAAAIACSAAVFVLFFCGSLWLSVFARLSLHHMLTPHQIWMAAVAPFLPGEAFKVLCAAGVYSTIRSGTIKSSKLTRAEKV
jgi:biotin transport system substrate-specific component